ncbi:ATP-binding protein [Halobaculum sp. MBLA0143]|uniref:sensor histidine kinase n=1 Tax=Halobaculum sp. MBLA0143 TaxID=3079933 RepID=UPI003525666A
MPDSPEEVTFTVDSRLLEELGENLVTRNHVALAELVKNAYDADATEVDLIFENAREGDEDSRIIVRDDGTGMTTDDIRDGWMRVATTDKLQNPRTEKYGRKKAGDKGIGRFAVRRLADELYLTSVSKDPVTDQYQRIRMNFDWERFERQLDLDEIPVRIEVERLNSTADVEAGTTLELVDLRDEWNKRHFNTLRRNIVTLSLVESANRDSYEPDPGFDINFDAPEFDAADASLLEQVHDASWGTLTGQISNGMVSVNLEAKKIGERNYEFSFDTDGLDGTAFKISWPPEERKHLRDTGTLSLERIGDIRDEYAGVRVYKDGFRVHSYGGPEDDWLGLDEKVAARKRNPDKKFHELKSETEYHRDFSNILTIHPRNNQLIGRVNVSPESVLEMQANREEFTAEGDGFKNLKQAVRLSIEWMVLQYSNYKHKLKMEEVEEAKEEFEKSAGSDSDDEEAGIDQFTDSSDDGSDTTSSEEEVVDAAMNFLEKTASTVAESGGSASTADGERDGTDQSDGEEEGESSSTASTVDTDTVEKATDVIRSSLQQKDGKIDFFRSAFSVNQVVFSLSHELRNMTHELSQNAVRIENNLNDLPQEQRDEFREISESMQEVQGRLKQHMDLFGTFAGVADDQEQSAVTLADATDQIVDAVSYICEFYGIEVEVSVPSLLQTPPMYDSEVSSILINLVTNSIKAIAATGNNAGRIEVRGEKIDDGVAIRVLDDGIGISDDVADRVTEPLVSDPSGEMYDSLQDNMPEELVDQLGNGSGLGLHIVNNISSKYGGTVRFPEMNGWSTCVEVTLRE